MSDHFWNDSARTKHLYVPGMSGYGKTSLMANLAIGDLEFQHGPLILIDPKGGREGLVERVLPHIPKGLIEKTFYISLDHPVPIDMLGCRSDREKQFIKSDIITILKRFSYGQWGTTMQSMLNHLIPTLLECPDATFLDIANFLESKKRRQEILSQVSKERREYWHENEPSPSDKGPILSRMSNFVEEPFKTIVGAKRGDGLSIAEIIENNQILLVDTSPWSEDGLILGALIMSRIQQAIFRRTEDQKYERCQVYADEFHNFATSAFNTMLSMARSFNLSLCLANQHPKQIGDLWDDIIGNVSSYMLFRMDGTHAMTLRSKLNEVPVPDTDEILRERQLEIDEIQETIRGAHRYIKHRKEYLAGNYNSPYRDDDDSRSANQAESEIVENEMGIEAPVPFKTASLTVGNLQEVSRVTQLPQLVYDKCAQRDLVNRIEERF